MSEKSYEVHLEMFEGPLDLLLHLIKKNDLDVENIAISEITREYLQYLDLMKELNLEVAGDFLVMAATLMQIKARSLLPSQALAGEDGPDPRLELVAKLVEYQKFKAAAALLETRADEFSGIFYRGAPRFGEREKSLNIRIFDLLSTLREVLDRAEDGSGVVSGEEFPLEEKIEKILRMLDRDPTIKLIDIFFGERKRRAIITCLLALLELIKTQRVFARQDSAFGEILIYKKANPPEEVAAVWPSAASEGAGASDGGGTAGQGRTPDPQGPERDSEQN